MWDIRFFSTELIKDFNQLTTCPFFINQHLSLSPVLKGENKWTCIGYESQAKLVIPKNLPHMIMSHYQKTDDSIVYCFKNGVYAVTVGLNQTINQTEYKNVKHLSENDIEPTFFFFHYIYAEMIKLNNKEFSDAVLRDKFEKFMMCVGEWTKLSEKIKDNSFIMFKRLLERPIYRDIPLKYREKALNEIAD